MNHYSLIRYSLTTYTSFVCAPINSATVSRASAVRALLSAAFLPPGRMYSMKTLMMVFLLHCLRAVHSFDSFAKSPTVAAADSSF